MAAKATRKSFTSTEIGELRPRRTFARAEARPARELRGVPRSHSGELVAGNRNTEAAGLQADGHTGSITLAHPHSSGLSPPTLPAGACTIPRHITCQGALCVEVARLAYEALSVRCSAARCAPRAWCRNVAVLPPRFGPDAGAGIGRALPAGQPARRQRATSPPVPRVERRGRTRRTTDSVWAPYAVGMPSGISSRRDSMLQTGSTASQARLRHRDGRAAHRGDQRG